MIWFRFILPVLGVLLGSYFLLCVAAPDRMYATATAEIDAPLSQIHSSLVELDRWPDWSPFLTDSSSCSFGPIRRGIGAEISWTVGGGRTETHRIVSDDCAHVVMEAWLDDWLRWEEHWHIDRNISSALSPTSQLTWEFIQEDVPFLMRGLLVLRGTSDENARARARAHALAEIQLGLQRPDWHRIKAIEIPQQLFAGQLIRQIPDGDLRGGSFVRDVHAKLIQTHTAQFGTAHADALTAAPMTAFIVEYDPVTETMDLLYAFPIDSAQVDQATQASRAGPLILHTLKAGEAWTIDHFGPQHLTGDAWGALYANSAAHSRSLKGWPYEVYQGSDLLQDSTDLHLCNQRIKLVYPMK